MIGVLLMVDAEPPAEEHHGTPPGARLHLQYPADHHVVNPGDVHVADLGVDTQEHVAQAYIEQLGKARVFKAPIVTKVDKLQAFYPAEDYHQNFLVRNPYYPYIAINDMPKVEYLKRLFSDLYRAKPVLVAVP